jgi:hypothetical protein
LHFLGQYQLSGSSGSGSAAHMVVSEAYYPFLDEANGRGKGALVVIDRNGGDRLK